MSAARPKASASSPRSRGWHPGGDACLGGRAWPAPSRNSAENAGSPMSSRFGRPGLVLAGAAEGLGASIAKTFAAAGHDVLGLARSDRATAHLTELVGEAGGEYSHLACDVTQPTQVADALRPH